ncbi:HAD family hydrolase [Streptomyces sp. NPDC096193]|uniref:HAD family hydrolase n=1 Tax=Streptomyces sp. NPDC096193 TaxID=3155821 RepID=UPI003323891D
MLALFDLDDTLVDRCGGLEDWARGFVRSRRLPAAAQSVICERLRQRAYPADFVHLRDALGLSDDPGDLWREYVDGIARSVRCSPGVLEGLEVLRAEGWTLGIATNGAGDIQRAKLAASGLALHFDGICVSEEVGARKPAREHFDAAAALCGMSLSAGGWMVGDNPATDIAGGRAAGLRTVLVSGGRERTGDSFDSHLVVRVAAEAIAVIRASTGGPSSHRLI